MTEQKPTRDEFKASLQGCARCGGNHDAVIFKRLQKPVKVTMTGAKNDDYEEELANFWGLCPATGEPILNLVTEIRMTK